MKTSHALRTCHACNATIRRAASDSWPTYNKKTACSLKCAAMLRESKERNKINAMLALAGAISKWRIAA